jgi:Tfp pilus assembly ATPase PilU
VRLQLGLLLRGVVCQRLVKRADGQGRVAAIEIMLNTSYVRQLIEEGATRDIEKAIAEGSHYHMQTFNQALYNLWMKGLISEEEARINSTAPDDLLLLMRGIKRGTSSDETSNPTAQAASPHSRNMFSTLGGKAPPGNIPGAVQTTGNPTDPKKKLGRGFDF